MALTDFFRINMPYGINRNSNGEWFAFNREYVPIGWNSTANQKSIFLDNVYGELPIYTKYKGLTELKLTKLAGDEGSVKVDDQGKINRVYFYTDRTNPTNNKKYWDAYFEKIKILSALQTK